MTISLSHIFISLIKRDIRLAWSQGGTGTMTLSFFLIAVSLFPFGVGADKAILATISSGVIWVIALLACLISLDRLFQADFEDGTLEDLALSPLGVHGIVIAKCIAHWIATLIPLIILAPVLGVMLNLPEGAYGTLLLSLLIGTPALSFIGSIGASLTVAMRRGGVLVSLLVLPLYIPTLIFAVSSIEAATSGQEITSSLMILGAVTILSFVISPIASAAALKLALE